MYLQNVKTSLAQTSRFSSDNEAVWVKLLLVRERTLKLIKFKLQQPLNEVLSSEVR